LKHQLKTDRQGVNVWPYASAMLDESSQVKSIFVLYCITGSDKNYPSHRLPVNSRNLHALFSVCSLRDDNMITSKTYMKLKHANPIVEYFEYLCPMSSKINPYKF